MNRQQFNELCNKLQKEDENLLRYTAEKIIYATLEAVEHRCLLTPAEEQDFKQWLAQGYTVESWYYFSTKEVSIWQKFGQLMELRQDIITTQRALDDYITRLTAPEPYPIARMLPDSTYDPAEHAPGGSLS